jgi:hypothetical protein
MTQDECKSKAIELLIATDWVEYPSVSNMSFSPHLKNQNELIEYRLKIRQLAVSPTENPTFPSLPESIWVQNDSTGE